MRHGILVNFKQLIDIGLRVKPRLVSLAGLLAISFVLRGVLVRGREREREFSRVTRLGQDPVHAVSDDLGEGTVCRRDRRHPEGHGLDRDQAEGLLADGRQHDRACPGHQVETPA